jgi:hypothetical protein
MAKSSQQPGPMDLEEQQTESNLPDDRERLLSAFERIVRTLQSKLDLNLILDTLSEEALRVGLFSSLSIALVDDDRGEVVVRRRISQFVRRTGEPYNRDELVYPMDDSNITPSVARSGETAIIDGWDDRFLSDIHPSNLHDESVFDGKTFFFVPFEGR